MLSALATSLASSASSAACFTHAPMLGAVGAAMAHLRPWLASRHQHQQSRGVAAQAALCSMLDSDSDAEQQPAVSLLSHPPTVTLEKPAPIPAVQGRIHSVDTFSAVDGPGLRMVVFEQVRRERAAVWGCVSAAPLRTTVQLLLCLQDTTQNSCLDVTRAVSSAAGLRDALRLLQQPRHLVSLRRRADIVQGHCITAAQVCLSSSSGACGLSVCCVGCQ
jgi:hypothetical protein